MIVADWMSKDIVSFRPDQRLLDVEEVLVRERITGGPVVEDGVLVGVISRSDLVRQLEVERSKVEAANHSLDPFDRDEPFCSPMAVSTAVAVRWAELKVRDVMLRDVVSVAPGDTLREAARMMAERGIHRVIVLVGGQPIGALSALDVVRAAAAHPDF